ncbi:hypothetical protein [Streptomyces sp. PTD5-9]|uniref:hypothetical protein n=1 Tax=Streptomyces sp. PTD5-9 TaxID=3120150 RepID=UPI003007F5A2
MLRGDRGGAWLVAGKALKPFAGVGVGGDQVSAPGPVDEAGKRAIEAKRCGEEAEAASHPDQLAKPSCQIIKAARPYKHGGSCVAYDATLNCNTSGLISFSVGIQQYRGLGLWENKASKNHTICKGSALGLTPSWNCAGTGTRDYRGKITNAVLRAIGGTWAATGMPILTSKASLKC